MEETSITEAKAAFLRSQIRVLSTPLQPSPQWRDLVVEAQEGHISDKVLEEVVVKVNEKIKTHNRMVFSAQSQRHVAEQIETLLWNRVRAEEGNDDINAVAIQRRADLTESEAVKDLPEGYTDLFLHSEHDADLGDGQRYEQLRSQLLELSQRRDEAQTMLSKYKRLQELLKPYQNPQENIQPNLVTRDGELAKELDKMRILLAKVTARIEKADNVHTDTAASNPPGLDGQQKLQRLMEMT